MLIDVRTPEQVADYLRTTSAALIRRLKRTARREPWNGRSPLPASRGALLRFPNEPERFLSILLSFDVGYHVSGWWRNSQYDRCWHLSICGSSRVQLFTPELYETQGVARAFFGDDVRFGWVEPPAGDFDEYRNAPASRHTYHVRIFVDRETGQAIQPEGEVYDLVPFGDGTSPVKVFR